MTAEEQKQRNRENSKRYQKKRRRQFLLRGLNTKGKPRRRIWLKPEQRRDRERWRNRKSWRKRADRFLSRGLTTRGNPFILPRDGLTYLERNRRAGLNSQGKPYRKTKYFSQAWSRFRETLEVGKIEPLTPLERGSQ